MTKGMQTREMILERTAQLFSRQGFFGSSLSDIMQETGLEKGGIYNHFSSKEQLAFEAFDYAVNLVRQRVRSALQDKKQAIERLHAMTDVFCSLIEDPIVEGGCPILNTAIEADDAHPMLAERARRAMDEMRDTLQRILTKGIERGEIRPDADIEAFATLFISTMEGAIMLSKLYRDSAHIRWAAAHLNWYIDTILPSLASAHPPFNSKTPGGEKQDSTSPI